MKILLATDGSDSARTAVDLLLCLPLPHDSEVRVVTVVKEVIAAEDRRELSEEQLKTFESARQSAEEEANDLLASEAERFREAGWAGSTELLSGHAAHEIVNAAADYGADMVVVGSHGLKGVRRFLLGSVSDQVLKYSPCSVLIVKPTEVSSSNRPFVPGEERAWRLLVAFDGSEPARRAVELCASMHLNEDSEVKALSVLPLIKMFRQDVRQQLNWVWQEKKEMARQGLEWVEKEIHWATPHVTTELTESPDVAHTILDTSSAMDSDLIVLGHKGKGAVAQFLTGSVTMKVAHHAPCSVLAIRD